MIQRCRCCLKTNSETFYDIFEQHKSGTTYAENIGFLAEVHIEHNDGLSQQICSNCYDEVQRIYEFCLKVRQADQKLRQEFEATKSHMEDEVQMENVQLLDNEYFTPVEVNGMQVCVMEEILEHESDHGNVLIVEEINDVEEINIVDEVLDTVKDQQIYEKDNLLQGLAQVAATQENVNIIDNQSLNSDTYLPEDENDGDYLIEYDPNEKNNIKPEKWKCGECKIILRGDVSYEGHMNIHRQFRPHACDQCKIKYRCRAALKRHKNSKHSLPITNDNPANITFLCILCTKSFYSECIFCIHQALVHCQGDKCPFKCRDISENSLKQHLERVHYKEIISAGETFCLNGASKSPKHQCFGCSGVFREIGLLWEHVKLCEVVNKQRLPNDIASNDNKNIIEIVTMEETEISVQCDFCPKKLLKKNMSKHMELHKRKEEDNKVLEDTKCYMCALCYDSFKSEDQLDDHLSSESCRSQVSCGKCNKNFADFKLLQKHRREVHSTKCYICKVCGNLFGGRAQLSAHKRLHRVRPFKCKECDKAYPRKVELEIHMRTHTGELPYECHLCDKRFAIKVRLTYHLQKHEGITHNCTYCSAVYDSRNKLKTHLFKHTGMPYKCELCPGLGFERRLRFSNHMRRVHQQNLSEDELTQVFAKNTGKFVHFKNPTN